MKYLKKFQNVSDYDAFKSTDSFVLPNVSYTVDNNTVYYNPYQPSSYIMVDLGLPSGLLWADRNIGAASPDDNGLYFAWGDTVGYTAEQVANGEKNFSSDWSDYFDTTDIGGSFNKYTPDKLTVLQPEDDAATVNMGSKYRMPTNSEFRELINNCTVTFIDLEGNEFSQLEEEDGAISGSNLKGIKFIGSNSNSIFIPAAGYCLDASINDIFFVGCLWASDLYDDTFANRLLFDADAYCSVSDSRRYTGNSIRAVQHTN